MLLFHTDDRPTSLHRREGLTHYLNNPVTAPAAMSAAELVALDPVARAAYDRARVLYLSGGIVINTPHLTDAKRMLSQSFADNVGRNSGHTGLMLTGDSTVGKTTALKALMLHTYSQYGRQFPGFDDTTTVPVVYIEVPAASTGKLLMRTFADFFGISVKAGESMGSIRARVVDLLNAAGTQLIVVDELHNLATRTAGNGESVDLLKNLHNDLAATFVYAGIDLLRGDLLAGPRGQQISGRFSTLEMRTFNLSDTHDRTVWRALPAAFERNLHLTDHQPGTLEKLSDYLYERTSGSIGSLARLLTGAAIEAITNEKLPERIDQKLLDTRTIDHTAERSRAKTRSKHGLADEDNNFT